MIRTTLGFRCFAAVGLAVSLAACGGGGGKTPGTSATPLQPVETTQHGQFVDAPVAGLNYRTATHQGLTGAQGQFNYEKGETIQFFLGDLALGAAVPAAPVITPIEVLGSARSQGISAPAANVAWLLQSLDTDCNDANGIQIADAVRSATTGRAIDFTDAAFLASASPATLLVAQAGPSCRQANPLTMDEARASFATQLADLAPAASTGAVCTAGQWCVGSSKTSISPTADEVDGQTEARAGGAYTVNQYFHLGGFGFGPFESTKMVEALLPSFDQRACAPGGGDTCASNPPAKRAWHCVNAFQPGFSGDCDESQKRRTYVRAFYLSQAGGQQVMFITVDAIGAGNIIMDGMKKAVADATGVPFDSVLTGATHSHAGADLQGLWGGVPEEWVRNLYTQAAAAAVAAKSGARAATVTYATGQETAFNSYRRPRVDPNANTDKTLSVLQARDSNNEVLGTLVQYAAHPTGVGESAGGALGRAVYADYPIGLEDTIEGATGAPAIYYNGPIADASGSGATTGTNDYDRTYSRGQCLAKSALTLLNPAVPQQCSFSGLNLAQTRRVTLTPSFEVHHTTAILPVTNPAFAVVAGSTSMSHYYDFNPVALSTIPGIGPIFAAQQAYLPEAAPTAKTTVSRLTLGGAQNGLEIVTIPGESTNTFGQYIRGLAATPNMMLLGLTQNSFGYILPEEEFNYIDPSGDAGFVLPFTGYEEFVSLGPLTAPLLRLQAYNPLFDIPLNDPRNAPPSANACLADSTSRACLFQREIENFDYIQRAYAQQCTDNLVANAPAAQKQQAQQFCNLINPSTPIASICRQAGLGDALCDAFGNGPASEADPRSNPVVLAAASSALLGCDVIDPSDCLYPFPSDHFTAASGTGPTFKTGKHVNFLPTAMPRNTAGKPIDPTEWNRNDGFSPGSMIAAVVPGLDSLDALKATYGFNNLTPANMVGITNFGLSLQPGAPIEVLEVGAANASTQHPVWSELDVNAGTFLNLTGGDPIGVTDPAEEQLPGDLQVIQRPGTYQTSLLLRPAKNFAPGKRYVVVLRNLKNTMGAPIKAGPVFQACKAQFLDPTKTIGLGPIDNRCAELRTSVLPVLQKAGVAIDDSLFLAWDFTVASTENTTARLVHMRDEAFRTLANKSTADCSKHSEPSTLPATPDLLDCRAPEFTVDSKTDAGDFWQIEGTVKTPSFLNQGDASPQDDAQLQPMFDRVRGAIQSASSTMRTAQQQCASAGPLASGCSSFFGAAADAFNTISDGVAISQTAAAIENNRLHYRPNDDGLPTGGLFPDPASQLYGDGLPDLRALGSNVSTRYKCRIPKAAYDPLAQAYRPSLYGHGLLGSRDEVGSGPQNAFARDQHMMMCAIDWYGFAEGDIGNVASTLVDLSQFPVVPDASQQGFVNWMFLSRAIQHPAGFAAHAEFQKQDGTPVFDRREVFYDGNSQGGILPGPIVAVSKDINRAVFGVPGMNYSTLLRRSVDFTGYSVPLYLSYQNELDRNVAFGLIQMLWDRAENDGYAAYLTPAGKLDGQDNFVLLHPSFGDHQVSMWTPDVMARTIGGVMANDHSRVDAAGYTHPDVVPFRGIPAINYVNDKASGSAEVVFVEPNVAYPPIDETPPSQGHDPHGFPRSQPDGQCQKSNFLRTNGFVARTNGLDAAGCIAKFGAVPTVAKPGFRISGSSSGGLLGLVGDVMSNLNTVLQALASGNFSGAGDGARELLADLQHDLTVLVFGPNDGSIRVTIAHAVDNVGDPLDLVGDLGRDLGLVIGLSSDPVTTVTQSTSANRKVEPVTLTGADVPGWSSRPAAGVPYPYPSGAVTTGQLYDAFGIIPGQVRNAHNGQLLYPAGGQAIATGVPVGDIAAYAWRGGWVEIPVQVDEKAPYFLANANSDFSVYSGTDQEVSYVWDNGDPHTNGVESWGMTGGTCSRAYDTNGVNDGPNNGLAAAVPDPVKGLDDDDEITFMASDAGDLAPATAKPAGASDGQQIALADPLGGLPRYVYLFRKPGGSSFNVATSYVKYQRDANANQWIDRTFFADNDPLKIGTSNTGYGPNLQGTVCPDGTATSAKSSNDRFPRDGVTVSTSGYKFYASGRWMVRELHIAKPNQPGVYGADVIDRWKGRAFQQSPDSTVSLVGFEDEQVNWEANSSLLGERCGAVRCIREVWGADSGTNVTKTETFYRDAITYRYHLRVHPIPPDGLYTSWDYNRGAMLPTSVEQGAGVAAGRYFTSVRPQGVPIDGVNDDAGNVDSLLGSPAFFDVSDPTFNPPLAIDNWEQVSAKGDLGSLVYTFEIKGITSFVNALVVPYYRDDACLDDGTGDDPVQRPYPGEATTDSRVKAGYAALAGKPYEQIPCAQKQGAYGQHGVHFFFTGDTDNAFSPVTSTEVDGQQWQFLVPTASPQNVGEPYANTVRLPLKAAATPRP